MRNTLRSGLSRSFRTQSRARGSRMRVPSVISLGLTALVMLSGLVACADERDQPDIVVTTNILGDVVSRMVGNNASVQVLMKPNADPHSFGISAQEAGDMEQADLIVANGLGLEEGLSSNLDNARQQGVPLIEVGEEVDPISYASGVSGGDLDPHFWTDPARMIRATEVIEAELLDVFDGDLAEDISASAESYRSELEALDAEVAELLDQVPSDQRTLVTNHHVFGYLAQRFDYEVVGAIVPGGTTLAAPSAADLRDLAEAIQANEVPAIFADSSQPLRLAEVLADTADVDVEVISLYTESLTEPDGEAGNYVAMQRINAERISAALS